MKEKSELERARYLLLRRLSKVSAHSEQLVLYLQKKGFSAQVIEEALQLVRSLGFIDDSSFVSRFVSGLQNRGKSTKDILSRAYQKNIPINQIKTVLLDQNDEENVLRQLIERKYQFLLDPEIDYKKRQKGIASLYRKGFAPSLIQKILSHDI